MPSATLSGSLRTVYPWGNDADVIYQDGVLTSRFNFNAVVGASCVAVYLTFCSYFEGKGKKKGGMEQKKYGCSRILFFNVTDSQRPTTKSSRLVPTLTRARLLHTGLPFDDTRRTQTKKIRFLRHEHAEFQGETCRFSTRKTGFFDPQYAMFQNPKSPESRVPTGSVYNLTPAVPLGCRRVSVVFIPARSAQARV